MTSDGRQSVALRQLLEVRAAGSALVAVERHTTKKVQTVARVRLSGPTLRKSNTKWQAMLSAKRRRKTPYPPVV